MIRALLPLIALAACAPKDLGRTKGLEPSLSTADVLSQALAPRRYALLVGVDDYADPAFPDLKHAGHDATALGEVLASETSGGFDVVRVLTGTGRTDRDDVLVALRELRSELRREDTLVVYFSGHGTRIVADGLSRRFLLVHDTAPGDLEGSAIDLADLQGFFGALPPARKALIVDACFSGDGKSVLRPADAEAAEPPLLAGMASFGPGEAHLFATSPGRPSREDDRLGHGVYTWFLLDALSWSKADADLDDDGVVTAYEAHDHARGQVIAHTDGVQVPEAAFRVVGEADVVLTGDPKRRQARDRALVYLYPASDHGLAGARVFVDGRDRGALPGTVPVTAGRHVVRIERADGEVVVDGSVRLASGRSYRADDLVRVAQGPAHTLGARAVVLGSEPLGEAIGDGAAGIEVWGGWRVQKGPQRGLYAGWSLAGGAARPGGERPIAWAGVSGGYQNDVAAWRYRLGWGATTLWLPPAWDDRPDGDVAVVDHPDAVGWVVVGTGPVAGLGWVVSDGWALTATVRPHAALLDADLDGTLGLVPLVTSGIGLEAAW